jgi:hypothetical protein
VDRERVLVAIFSVYGQTRVVEARAALPSCETECHSGALCNAECEYPAGESWVFTTCGAYNGGGSSYCDGNTCEDMCGPHAPAAWECFEDFVLSSCYEQDNHAECGDDVCAWYYGAESWANCADDCGPPPPGPTCGEDGCEDGESWMNCPADCQVPEPSTCPNGFCDEDPSECPEDCDVPKLSCRNWPCPTGYSCVNGQCISSSGYFQLCFVASPSCPLGTACIVVDPSEPQYGRCILIPW